MTPMTPMTPARRRAWVWGLLALWALCVAISFVAFARTEPTGESFLRGINRVGVFLGWHVAGVVPALAAFSLARPLPRGAARRASAAPVWLYGSVLVGLLALVLWSRVQILFQDPVPNPPPVTETPSAVDP